MNANSIERAQQKILKTMSTSIPARDPRIKGAADILATVPFELQDLVADSDGELTDLASAAFPVEQIEAKEPRQLTQEERQTLDSEILRDEIFGVDGLRCIGIENISGQPDAENLQELIDRALTTVIAAANRGDSRPLEILNSPEFRPQELYAFQSRIGGDFARKLAMRAEEFESPTSPITAFLKGFAHSDQAAMREAVRTMVRAT